MCRCKLIEAIGPDTLELLERGEITWVRLCPAPFRVAMRGSASIRWCLSTCLRPGIRH